MLEEGIPITMKVDTGAEISTLPETVYRNKNATFQLKSAQLKIKAYDGRFIQSEREIEDNVSFKDLVSVVVKSQNNALWVEIFLNHQIYTFEINKLNSKIMI